MLCKNIIKKLVGDKTDQLFRPKNVRKTILGLEMHKINQTL